MPSKKRRIEHAEIVKRFAARLRERRLGAGLTQAALARLAHLTPSYVGRLEAAGAAPGIDTLQRLAVALGTTEHDILPLSPPPDPLDHLKARGKVLFDELLQKADRELMQVLVPLLARLIEGPARVR
ncbi:MAG TPA: helix-turn-helix transcriptional regulator [Gemmataceae bacterium]|jgi:transcriptional regulator with XRE-family HTH domain|nr:helix-turn-helix transcriptional regulator [Gemmataceae bacterium]